MAILNIQDAVLAGVIMSEQAANAGGDSFPNNGLVVVVARNPTGGSISVTADDPGSVQPEGAAAFNPDVTVAVPAGASRVLGPFPPFRFNDASGRVNLTYTAAGLLISPIRVRS